MPMKLVNKSRRYFDFSRIDGVDIEAHEGIKVEGNTIRVPISGPVENKGKRSFETPEKAMKYLVNLSMQQKGFRPNEPYTKQLRFIPTEGLTIDDDLWDLMKTQVTNPDQFKGPEEFRAFESYLANNVVDRDRERFPVDVLKAFAKTIVGKGKLTGHEWSNPGVGRYFAAKVKKMSVDEALPFFETVPFKNVKAHLEEIAEFDGGIYWLVVQYYQLNVTEADKDYNRRIDAGIVRDMSIGFKAPDIQPIFDPDNERVRWLEYRNTDVAIAEALEGSDVWLGAQYSAGTMKSAGRSMSEQDSDRKIESEGKKMPVKFSIPMLEIEKELDPDALSVGVDDLQATIKQAVNGIKADALKHKQALDAIQEKVGTTDPAELAAVFEMARRMRKAVVDEAIKYGTLAGLIENDDQKIEEKRKFFNDQPIDTVEQWVDQYKSVFDTQKSGEQLDGGEQNSGNDESEGQTKKAKRINTMPIV